MVCDRVAIMVKGKMAMQGTIDELTQDSNRIEVHINKKAPSWAQDAFDYVQDSVLTLRGDNIEKIQPLIDRLRTDQITICAITPTRDTLEDLFMRAIDYVDNPGSVQ